MAEKEQDPVSGVSVSSTPREQRAGGRVEGGREPGATPARGSRTKKTGKEKRREKRLRNEPQSVSGEQTPVAVNVYDFAEARAMELKVMTEALAKKPGEGGKRVFQQLPRHMRRRAMSYNIRRLPRRLQEKAAKEMEKQTAEQEGKKKKSRRQRRKIRNLREERTRRSGRGINGDHTHPQWLETHVWHAKRMRMIHHHGYRVAGSVCDKGVRQAYRSLRYGCLLSDVSYECCIELTGRRCDIISCLTPFFNRDIGKTPAALAYRNGSKAGHTVMYHSHAYPFGAIGPVEFLWQPVNNDIIVDDGDSAKLWLTVSPAIHDEVMEVLNSAVDGFCSSYHGDDQIESKNVSEGGDELRGSKVTVTSLRDEFVRFRLIGPRCHAVLMETLKLITEGNETLATTSDQSDSGTLSFSKPDLSLIPYPVPWWKNDRILSRHTKLLGDQLEELQSASEAGDFPKGTVLGMVVQDPRLFTPNKKTDMVSRFYPKRKVDWWGEEGSRGGGEEGVGGEGEEGEGEEGEGEEGEDSGKEGGTNKEEEEQEEEEEEDVVEVIIISDEEEEEGEMEVEIIEVEEGDQYRTGTEETELEILEDVSHIETESTSIVAQQSSRQPNMEVMSTASSSLPNLSYSPLWNPQVRETVSKSKIPEHILNKVRSNILISTTQLYIGDKSPRIPVILIRQDYSSSHVHSVLQLEGGGIRGYKRGVKRSVATSSVSGWDLVLPREWGMGFWVSLVYRGARACGRTELQKCHLETGSPFFLDDFPDTKAGRKEAERRGREAEAKYRRYPPDKRRNFGKLLTQHPFSSPWGELVGGRGGGRGGGGGEKENGEEVLEPPAKRIRVANGNDSDIIVNPETPVSGIRGESSDFYVLRSKSALFSLGNFFCSMSSARPGSHSGTRPGSHSSTTSNRLQTVNSINSSFDSLVRDFKIDRLLEEHHNALVGITFEMLSRGNATNNDIISIPTHSDLQNLTDSDKNFNGPEETLCLRGLTVVEGDVVCVGVSGLSRSKMAEIKKERRKRKKSVEEEEEEEEDIRKSKQEVASSIRRDYVLSPVSQSRRIIGYTTSCGHRFSSSKEGGIGFCSLRGLVEAARVYHDFRSGGRRGEGGRGEGGGGKGGEGGREEERGGGRGGEGGKGWREEGGKGRRIWKEGDILLLIRGAFLHHRFARFDLLHYN